MKLMKQILFLAAGLSLALPLPAAELPNLKELMDKIGVKGQPDIWVTKCVL